MSYRTRQGGGPPTWLTFIVGIAFVFGGSYLWSNFQTFLRSGGISVSEATAIAQDLSTSTAIRQVTNVAALPTRRPSATPKPACQNFEVTAPNGIVRQTPSTDAPLLESLPQATTVCVLESIATDDGFIWYFIDRDAITNFIEPGYMREDVVRPLNPTPTPSNTAPPPPTITLTPTPTATNTPSSVDD